MPPTAATRDWVKLALGGSRVLSLGAVGIGVAEVLAWVVRPAWIPPNAVVYWMKANGALCVALLGLAALLIAGRVSGGRRAAATVLAVAVLAICGVTLVEYASTWNPGIDAWFGPDPTIDAGRMAAQTAANLSLFALSILSFGWEAGPGSWLCDACLLVAALILEVMVAGYFDNARLLYDVTGRSQAATQSAMAQMMLCAALALGRTGRGAFEIFAGAGMGSTAMRTLMLVVIALPLALGKLRALGGDHRWIDPYDSYTHAIFSVVQTVVLGVTVYGFARYVNRLDARYRAERERRAEIERYVAVCAWTRKIRWQGRWVSIEEFLQQRFGFEVTHGISDEALAEQLASLDLSDQEPAEGATGRE